MDLSKPVIIKADGSDFVVLFHNNIIGDHNMNWNGSLLPIYLSDDGSYFYHSNSSSGIEPDINKARFYFDFSYCWRGVWEGRIYFKDDEFWCEEIAEINDAWNQIEKILKDRIKADNPDYGHFDE